MQQPPQIKSLPTPLFTFNSTQKVTQIWTPNRPSTVICSCNLVKRQEIASLERQEIANFANR